MPVALTSIVSNFWKPRPALAKQRHHLLLAGINQKIFLSQWGEPEIQISLDRLRGSYESRSLSIRNESGEEDFYTVWIYEKKDRIFFFKKGRLISHFKWNEFRNRFKRPFEEFNSRPARQSHALVATTLALVA